MLILYLVDFSALTLEDEKRTLACLISGFVKMVGIKDGLSSLGKGYNCFSVLRWTS